MKNNHYRSRAVLQAPDRFASQERVHQWVAQFLADPDPLVRLEAVKALGPLGPMVVISLRQALADADGSVRREAATTLGRLGPAARDAVATLAAALEDDDVRVRLAAATALGSLGAVASDAIAALTKAMKGSNLILARLAAQALSRIGVASVPALIELLEAGDRYMRRDAAWALGEIGPVLASDAQPVRATARTPLPAQPFHDPRNDATALIPLDRRDVLTRWEEKATRPRAAAAPDALTALNTALTDDDLKVQQAAALALTRIEGTR